MKFLPFLVLILICFKTKAQQIYDYDWKQEGLIIIPSMLMIGSSFILDKQKTRLSEREIINAIPSINAFDRVALPLNSSLADYSSDFTFFAGSLAPVFLLASPSLEKQRKEYLFLLGETVALNAGLTLLTKSLTDRRRPYFYNDDFPIEERGDLDARKSFFSGHTSHSAAMSFFLASTYQDIYPESAWKKWVWTGALILPGVTAYLRVRAGQHYPSDVLVGYMVGAGVGTLIPFLHKKKTKLNSDIKLNFSGNGLRMTYQIN